MIAVEPFVKPAAGTREYRAVEKALKTKPKVEPLLVGIGNPNGVYQVKDQYNVRIWEDPDGQVFGECACPAGSPPADPPRADTGEETEVPQRQPVPCYHLASVLLFIAERENQDGGQGS